MNSPTSSTRITDCLILTLRHCRVNQMNFIRIITPPQSLCVRAQLFLPKYERGTHEDIVDCIFFRLLAIYLPAKHN